MVPLIEMGHHLLGCHLLGHHLLWDHLLGLVLGHLWPHHGHHLLVLVLILEAWLGSGHVDGVEENSGD